MKRKLSVEEGMREEKMDSGCSFFRICGWLVAPTHSNNKV